MKYIEKNHKNEPATLKEFRTGKSSENSVSYKGFIDTEQKLKKALLNEQGHLCAYCMKRISLDLNSHYKPKIEVEHYKSQENFPDKDLDYSNMLGVCNGFVIGKENEKIMHCDKSRDYKEDGKTHSIEFKVLNPISKNYSEDLITYELDGKIKSKANNPDVQHDIEMLNLNHDKLKGFRKNALTTARKKFEEKYPNKKWTQRMFDSFIENYKQRDKNGKYKPYCQIIIWYFELLKTKPKYQ